jgi:ElaB protein
MEVQMTESHQSTAPAAGSLPVASDPGSSAGLSQQGSGATTKSGGSDGDRTTSARTLSDLKDRIAGAQEVVKTKYRVVSESTDDYVHEAPWKAVTMALIGGLIIGMLARR